MLPECKWRKTKMEYMYMNQFNKCYTSSHVGYALHSLKLNAFL